MARLEARNRPGSKASWVEQRERLVRGYGGETCCCAVGLEHVDVFPAGEVVLVDVGEGIHCYFGFVIWRNVMICRWWYKTRGGQEDLLEAIACVWPWCGYLDERISEYLP